MLQITFNASTSLILVNIIHLIQMLEYKGALAGIKVITTEEAYTSKASSLDGDPLPKYGKTAPSFSGRRIKRGLYRSKDGRLINADVNGSLNIGRKVIPDFIKGIEALPFVPVVVDPLRMHLSTSVKQWLDMRRFV